MELTGIEIKLALTITPESGPSYVSSLKELKLYDVDRAMIEYGVEKYLESEFRIPYVDRTLLLALTAVEIAAYLKQIAGSKLFDLPDYRSMLEGDVAWGAWLTGLLKIGTIAGLAVGGMFALHMLVRPLPEAVRLGVIYATGIIAVPLTAMMTWGCLIDRRSTKLTDEEEKTVDRMMSFQCEVHGAGPLSVPHFRRLRDEARRDGVVWPKAAWALLDDIERRGITRI